MKKLALVLAMLFTALSFLCWSNPIFANTLPGSNGSSAVESLTATTFTSSADAYVDSSYPSTNYGASTQVRVDGSPTVKGYVRFSVQNLGGPVTKATLRFYANSSLATGIEVHGVSSNSWSESTITYSNAPALGTNIRTSSAVSPATWVSVDVTSYVTGNGTFSFGLVDTSTTALSLASRESANDPQLVVETGTSSTATPTTAVPTSTPGLPSTSVTFTSAADTYADSSYPSTNYGASTQVRVDGSPTVRSYLRFNVQNLAGPVSKATLRVYANTSVGSGVSVARVSDNSWNETTLTYSNAPEVGSILSTASSVTGGTWIPFDVTPFVTGNGTFSIAMMSTNATAVSLASRESANDPQLVVVTGSGSLPTPTSTSVAGSTPTPLPPPTNTPLPPPTATKTPLPLPTATPAGSDPYIFATGDSRTGCTTAAQEIANLLDKYPTSVPLLFNGDATDTGAYSEFTNCYNTTYGRHKAQIKPVPGNHEYMTSGASGYYQYYGPQAGPSGKGYYSFNVGAWHIVNLNSEIDISATGTEVAWLKADLAANPAQCTLAMWHRPRWSSGEHGNQTDTGAMYQALYDANAEIVLSGHDHDYERFALQNPSGAADSTRGIRQWVLGTGGVAFRAFSTIRTNSQVRNNTSYGLLKLTLHSGNYDWQYLPVGGGTLSDSGSQACH